MTRRNKKSDCRAFTLVEALIASVLLTFAVSAAIMPFTAGVQNDMYNGRKAEAVALAEDLMEEVLGKPFYDPDDESMVTPGPDSEEWGRSQFDNIDDYHGYTEQAGAIVPSQTYQAAASINPDLRRSVTVEYVHLTGQDGSNPANVCRIIVTVRDDALELARLSRLTYGDLEGH